MSIIKRAKYKAGSYYWHENTDDLNLDHRIILLVLCENGGKKNTLKLIRESIDYIEQIGGIYWTPIYDSLKDLEDKGFVSINGLKTSLVKNLDSEFDLNNRTAIVTDIIVELDELNQKIDQLLKFKDELIDFVKNISNEDFSDND